MKALPLLLAALLLPGLAAAQDLNTQWATDLSGLWILSTSLSGRPLAIDCNVLQIGADLFGSCEPEVQGAMPVALIGQIDGAQASWAYDATDQGRTSHLNYQAHVVSNAALTGTLTYGGVPAGFTAVRK